MKFYQCEKKNKMYVKFEEPKIHHAKKSRRFIQKKEIHQAQKVQVHWGKKEV